MIKKIQSSINQLVELFKAPKKVKELELEKEKMIAELKKQQEEKVAFKTF